MLSQLYFRKTIPCVFFFPSCFQTAIHFNIIGVAQLNLQTICKTTSWLGAHHRNICGNSRKPSNPISVLSFFDLHLLPQGTLPVEFNVCKIMNLICREKLDNVKIKQLVLPKQCHNHYNRHLYFELSTLIFSIDEQHALPL